MNLLELLRLKCLEVEITNQIPMTKFCWAILIPVFPEAENQGLQIL